MSKLLYKICISSQQEAEAAYKAIKLLNDMESIITSNNMQWIKQHIRGNFEFLAFYIYDDDVRWGHLKSIYDDYDVPEIVYSVPTSKQLKSIAFESN